ncbi:hypothetical protein ACVWWW_000639 [Lysobacter sp. HA18]
MRSMTIRYLMPLAYAALLTVFQPAMAGTPARFSGDSPVIVDALPPDRVAAIVDEASHARDGISTWVKPLPAQWKTLDRESLLALLHMPSFAEIPHETRGVLLNQAATWDLLGWQRPSDAARLWERVWPRDASADPGNAPNASTGIGYTPDPTWSTQARAMSTMFACFPRDVWSSKGEPMVEALRKPFSFQFDNYTGWDAFGRCAPEGAFAEETRPTAEEAAELKRFLADRLAGELYVDGCTRTGPESCLLLLHALMTLAPHDGRLPSLIKRLEPQVLPDMPVAVPDVRPIHMEDPVDASVAQIEAARDEAARRSVFLAHEIRVMVDRPAAWPAGALDRAVGQATDLAIVRARIQALYGWRWQSFDRYYDDPWSPLDASARERLAADQRARGATLAREVGCNAETLQINALPEFIHAVYVGVATQHCN